MSENNTQEAAPVQPMSVEAKVYPSKKEGNLLAFASVTLGGCFAVNNIRILNSDKGMFLAMPDRQDGKGEYRDVCFPTTAEMRAALNTAVLNECRLPQGAGPDEGTADSQGQRGPIDGL